MGQTADVQGTTMLSTALIKIISKIYNHPIKTRECLDYIESKGYTNEINGSDTSSRKLQKSFAAAFYINGPAAKEVDYLSEHIIGVKKAIVATLKSPRAWVFPLRRCSVQPMQGLQYVYSDGSNVSYSFEDMLDTVENPSIPDSVRDNYEEFTGWNLWGLPEVYTNRYVFLHTPQWVNDDSVSLSMTKNTNLLDNSWGIEKYDMKNLMSYDVHTLNLYLTCREEINNLVRFFKRVQGMYKAFWMPTWVNDISCPFDINAGDTEIITDFTKLHNYSKTNGRTRKLVVFTKDWTYYIFQVLTYGTLMRNGVEYGRILLTSPVATTIPKENILMISYLSLVRLDSDELQLNYETDWSANVQISFREVDDEFTPNVIYDYIEE